MTSARTGAYILGATCVTFDARGRVLINLRRSPERWEIPGGLVDPGEDFHAAAKREVLEETGVAVSVRGLVAVYQHPSRGILAGVFVADHVSGDPVPTKESAAAEWCSVDVALERLHPLYEPRLRDALSAERTAALRVHEGQAMLNELAARDNAAPRPAHGI